MYLATDPFDVARHKLRDLYNWAEPDATVPAPERGPLLQEEEPLQEDDDPW